MIAPFLIDCSFDDTLLGLIGEGMGFIDVVAVLVAKRR